MGVAKSNFFIINYSPSSFQFFNTIATPSGYPISNGIQPLAMPFNLPWGITQTIGTSFGSRHSILGG